MTPNIAAFLTMIATSEGTQRTPDPYRCCYAYRHTIQDLAYHPAESRPDGSPPEWIGERITVGQYAGELSSAAGRYQINRPTWVRLKQLLALPDFTGPSQDDACIQLIKERGALTLVNSGAVADAITVLHSTWASLPGSTAGQPTTSFADLIRSYTEAGGGFA